MTGQKSPVTSKTALSVTATMLAVVFKIAIAASQLEAAQISCEKLEGSAGISGKRCFMNSTTTISSADVTLADLQNADVNGLMFEFNKKIEFLPVDVYKNFPNLTVLAAKNCSLREISARNFENLVYLTFVDLQANHIKSIPNYCFDGLAKL